ncbi:MAG: TatD family hydrolase [Actinomycetaceae bacterium]|nr:TatD family hydrolase [Actinomycetaceae bacterium]MDU0970679.1 TatD family hydrolase [Actinomycetaceae bacterium]
MSKSRKRRGWPLLPDPLPTPIIDDHTHLPVWDDEIPEAEGVRLDIDEQLRRAHAVGVAGVITCGCELPALAPTVALTKRENVWAALAIHPNEAALHCGVREVAPDGLDPNPHDYHETSLDDALAEVARLATAHDTVVAIGETGLDYFRTGPAGIEAQKRSFAAHISLAKELGLPLQIHDRDAHADTIAVLEAEGAPERTVFHCFSGDAEMARVLADHGWYASFAGPVSFNANEFLREAARVMPADHIMVETDAPYLTPHPFRGQPNASYMTPLTLRALADARDESVEALARRTYQTTCEVYGLSPVKSAT